MHFLQTICYGVAGRLYALLANVRPSVIRCHISKTKQDRPIVTMEHYIEVSTADSVAALRSSPDAHGKIFWFHIKIRSTPASDRSCRQQSATVVICCEQSSSVVLTTPVVWRESWTVGILVIMRPPRQTGMQAEACSQPLLFVRLISTLWTWYFAIEQTDFYANWRKWSTGNKAWNGQLFGSGPSGVKGQSHTTPKIDVEAWRRHHPRPRVQSCSFSSFFCHSVVINHYLLSWFIK